MSASRQMPSRTAAANAKGTDATSGADVVHGGGIQASAPAAKAPLTLADRLAQTADARHSAISATRNKHNVRAYNSSSDWLAMSFSLRNRGLFTLRQPMLLVAICACGFTSVAEKYADVCETPFFLAETYEAFSLMITALAFMLVFRLNRSATRHYGAGELCGGMMIHARDPNPNPNPSPSPSPNTPTLTVTHQSEVLRPRLSLSLSLSLSPSLTRLAISHSQPQPCSHVPHPRLATGYVRWRSPSPSRSCYTFGATQRRALRLVRGAINGVTIHGVTMTMGGERLASRPWLRVSSPRRAPLPR